MLETKQTLRVAIYCRVGAISQAEDIEAHLRKQEHVCRDYVNSHEIHFQSCEVFEDIGSAQNRQRPGLKRLIEAVDRGDVGLIVTPSIATLTRNLVDLEELTTIFKKSNVRFLVADSGLELPVAMNEALAKTNEKIFLTP